MNREKKDMPTIYVRNVSTPDKPITIAPLSFGSPVVPIAGFDELPRTGPAILYIVAHAVPDGLRFGKTLIREEELAKALEYRKGQPTLIIFDACFAKSFSKIPDFQWPAKFGLIFSCLEHERTWGSGGESGAPLQSLFSSALDKAINDCLLRGSFAGLQAALVAAFGGIQNPFVEASDDLLREVFGINGSQAALQSPQQQPSAPQPTAGISAYDGG